jgi:hypothetical protein
VADRGHHAPRAVAERLDVPTLHGGEEVPAEQLGLPDRELGGRRRHGPVARVDDTGAVAGRPDVRHARHVQAGLDPDPPALDRQAEPRDQRVGASPDRAYDGLGFDRRPVGEDNTITRDPLRRSVEADLDALPREHFVRRRAQRLREFGQQARDVLDEGDPELVRVDPGIVPGDALQAVGQRAGDLDAREAAADQDEMPEAPAARGVGLELYPCQPAQHDVADVQRVADGLQRQRVLGHARDEVEPGAVAERQHQVVVRERPVAGQRRAGDRTAREVDVGDPPHHEAPAAPDVDRLAQRRDDMLGEDGGADDLGKHRIVGRVALLADQHDLPAFGKPANQPARHRGTGEAATDNSDPSHRRHPSAQERRPARELCPRPRRVMLTWPVPTSAGVPRLNLCSGSHQPPSRGG